MQYTAEEKGKQKASYQPIGDSQEARELEESLLLSRLQVAGSSSRKVLATNDPNMPGGKAARCASVRRRHVASRLSSVHSLSLCSTDTGWPLLFNMMSCT